MFGNSSSTQKQTPSSFLRVQTAVAGKAIAIGWGQARVSGNLIWYGDFQSQQSGGGSGGKGGGGGGKGSSGGSYTYSASVIIGLCEGPISAVLQVWNNSSAVSLSSLALAGYGGDYAASPWSYMSSVHSDQALSYRGLAYAAAAAMPLGNSANLPNLTFEVRFAIYGNVVGQPDANPRDVVTDFLTNAYYGAGMPSANVDAFSDYSNYCVANGLVVSPVISDQAEARSFLKDLLQATNSAAVWSSGVLRIVPYGDATITANGVTYTAPSAPLYSLSDIDFKAPQGSNSNSSSTAGMHDPVQCTRLRPSDQMNSVSVEYLDRSNAYNATVVEAKDDAGISLYRLRKAATKSLHFFCLQSAALMSAQLMLAREAVRNTYAFTLGPEYILLDPMDIIAVTDPNMGLNDTWLRITEITENTDATLSIQAEDALFGAHSAPLYQAQQGLATGIDFNAPVSAVTTPVIWEPTYALAGGTEIWMAIGAPANFGGCDIWVSTDGSSYQLAGTFDGSSRIGLTTNALPFVTPAVTGPTIDPAHTLGVDMGETGSQLLSGTQADAVAGNTLCYVDGEYLAYQTATLTSGTSYALSYLVRGLFDSAPVAAPASAPLVRLSPGTYFRYPITIDRVGQTLYFKFLPFNAFGAGAPTLDEVMAYPHLVTGVALAGPLAAPTGLTTSYVAQYTELSWIEVNDFRSPVYEIRKGSTWTSSQRLGSVAHPPFRVYGDDTYWLAAVCNPEPGLIIYSSPVDLSIQGSAIVSNILNTWNEAATGWTGTVSGGAAVSSGIVTTSGGLHSQVGGAYQIPTGHEIDVGRNALCAVLINWTSTGYPAGQNILSTTDWLAITDLLGASVAGNANVYPEISIDLGAGAGYGAWQRFVPGSYQGRKFRARMQIQTLDPSVTAALLSFTFYVSAPERDDHYLQLAVPTSGLSVTFKPDGGATAVAFNGGPQGAALPAVQGTILNASSGDTLVLSSLSLSGVNVAVINGGTAVARTVNLLVQGY